MTTNPATVAGVSAPERPSLRTTEVIRLAGCTYRQLDYWCRTYGICADDGKGSGVARLFTTTEAKIARCLTLLGSHGTLIGMHARAVVDALRATPDAEFIVLGENGVSAYDDPTGVAAHLLAAAEYEVTTVVRLLWA